VGVGGRHGNVDRPRSFKTRIDADTTNNKVRAQYVVVPGRLALCQLGLCCVSRFQIVFVGGAFSFCWTVGTHRGQGTPTPPPPPPPPCTASGRAATTTSRSRRTKSLTAWPRRSSPGSKKHGGSPKRCSCSARRSRYVVAGRLPPSSHQLNSRRIRVLVPPSPLLCLGPPR